VTRRGGLVAAALLALASPAAAQGVFLSPTEAQTLLASDRRAIVLDVGRTPEQFRERLPRARPVRLADVVESRNGIPNELPPVARLDSVLERLGVGDGVPVVVYGEPLAAARLWLTLDLLGHEHAHLLDGGLAAWKAAGLPLDDDEVIEHPRPGTFTPRLRAERLIAADELVPRHRDPAFLLVDARSPGEYAGTTQSPQVPRPGHIPGARSVFWKRLLVSDSMPALRDERELRALLAMPEGASTFVAYCRTGHMASMLYAVARELALPVRLYDPSFVEWSGRGDLPVEQGPPGSAAP
jgi:thiosulfate/3-mercaptopyruvate sulfurtransferase